MEGANVQNVVGARVRKLRESKKMLQQEVAEALHISVSAYAKLEAGTRGINSENCIALADLFGVSCDYILRGINHENANVWKETGLADRSIALIKAHKRYDLDSVFEKTAFWRLIERIEAMTDYINDPEETEKCWDANGYIAHKFLDRLLNELRREAIEYLNYEERGNVETIRDIRENGNEYEFEAEASIIERMTKFNL